jgi:hypothetical protein
MRIIARIPDLAAAPVAAEPPRDQAPRPAGGDPAPRPRPRAARLASTAEAALSWPVAALAMVAVVVWVLASWNDHARLQRQRGDVRLARESAAPVTGTAAEHNGAVLR